MEYILYDVDKIKDYVFDSFRPKEVKGASELLKTLDYDPKTRKKEALLLQLTEEFKEITDEEIIYSKGGRGVFKSTANNGKIICPWLETQFEKNVPGASLTAVYHQEEPHFATTMNILDFKAREKKSEKPVSRDLRIARFDKIEKNDKEDTTEMDETTDPEESTRCGACGKRTATKIIHIGDEDIPYCEICHTKHHTLDDKSKEKIAAESLEDLCKVPGLPDSKYILTIYGDLNEAGSHLANIEDEKGLKRFSEGIFDTLDHTRRDIESELARNGFKVLAPVIGGDDIIIFVHPAALSFIFEKLRCIEVSLSQLPFKEMKMNFSFLLSKYNFPIYHIFRLSQSLLEKTKDAYYAVDPADPENSKKSSYYGIFKVVEGGRRPSQEDVYPADRFNTLYKIATQSRQDEEIHKSALYNLLESISDRHSTAVREMNALYFLARHGEFRKYIKYIPPDFYLVRDGEKIVKLTPAALEDIIILQELAAPGKEAQ